MIAESTLSQPHSLHILYATLISRATHYNHISPPTNTKIPHYQYMDTILPDTKVINVVNGATPPQAPPIHNTNYNVFTSLLYLFLSLAPLITTTYFSSKYDDTN